VELLEHQDFLQKGKEKLRAETSLGKGKSDLAQIFSSLTSAGAKAQELKELQEKKDIETGRATSVKNRT